MSRSSVASGAVYVAVMAVLGAIASWPIYETMWAIFVIIMAVFAGAVLAALSRVLEWKPWLTLLVVVGAWFAVALAVAVPARWTSGAPIPGVFIDVLTGPITGWKDLITSPLPIGEYRNLLVPLFTVMFGSVFLALRLTWVSSARGALAVPVAALMPAFGLFFGRTSTSAPLHIGGWTITAPVELLTGAAAIVASLLWLSLRARQERRDALRRAEAATGIHTTATNRPATLRRVAIAAGMLVVALVVGVVATPALTQTRTRDVPRAALGPDLSQLTDMSPLSQYRNNFGDAEFDRELFTVTSEDTLPERIRIATLTDYDGEVFRASRDANDAFQRVPSTIAAPAGETSTVEVTIDGLRGTWLPTFGALEHATFGGADAGRLAEGFYYNKETGTAVQAAGLTGGDTYTLEGVIVNTPAPETLVSPGIKGDLKPPQTLVKWLDALDVSSSGAGLVEAIETLRERGYLSHALSEVEGETPRWQEALGSGYTFRASAAGHSLARVDQLFRQLLEREATSGANGSLVAAIGDDEQFAVAGALIANQLGFPARVVLGVRTVSADLPACTAGVCRSGDMSAWIEVQGEDGVWVALDTTPQHSELVSNETTRQKDPKNVTDVMPDSATQVTPPDPQREDGDDVPPTPDPRPNFDTLWATLRIVGLSLLGLVILLSPFIVILGAKIARRKSRRNDPDPVRAIAGGWDEYVDAAVDVGREAPTIDTRQELAAAFGTPAAPFLAATADRAVFGGVYVDPSETEAFWQIVADERRALRSDVGFWGRIRAALSLKSFRRRFADRSGAGDTRTARTSEGRKRRSSDAQE